MKTQEEIKEFHDYLSLALHGEASGTIPRIKMNETHHLMLYSAKIAFCWMLGCTDGLDESASDGGVGTFVKNMEAIKEHFTKLGIERKRISIDESGEIQ